jgi:hypothetical protein
LVLGIPKHSAVEGSLSERLAMVTAPDLVDQLARVAHPWASLYGDSTALQTTITFLHGAGTFLGGGFAIATDRETFIAMRAARLWGQIGHLAHLHTVHRPVLDEQRIGQIYAYILARSEGRLMAGRPHRAPTQ